MKTLLWLDDIRDPKGYLTDGNSWESGYSLIFVTISEWREMKLGEIGI